MTEYIENREQPIPDDAHDEDNVMYQAYPNEPEPVHANQS